MRSFNKQKYKNTKLQYLINEIYQIQQHPKLNQGLIALFVL